MARSPAIERSETRVRKRIMALAKQMKIPKIDQRLHGLLWLRYKAEGERVNVTWRSFFNKALMFYLEEAKPLPSEAIIFHGESHAGEVIHREKLDAAARANIIEKFTEKQASVQQLATNFNVGQSTIRRILQKYRSVQ